MSKDSNIKICELFVSQKLRLSAVTGISQEIAFTCIPVVFPDW